VDSETTNNLSSLSPQADLFERLVRTSPVGAMVFALDGTVRYANDSALRLLGLARDGLSEKALEWITDSPLADVWRRTLRGEATSSVRELVVLVDGIPRTLEVSVSRSDLGSGTTPAPPDVVVVRIVDHTRQQHLEDVLRSSEDRFRLLVESLPGVVYVAEPGPAGRWWYVSPQVEAILGFTADEWLAHPGMWVQHLHPQDAADAVRIDEEHALDGPRGTPVPQTYRMVRKDGSVVWIRDGASLVEQDGVLLYHGVLMDVTHEKVLEDRLSYLATHDELTGLANRTSLVDALRRALRDGATVTVAFVDLDRLKGVNDTWGHQVGDRLLREVGQRISEATSAMPGVLAARIAGDEFAVVDTDPGRESGSLGSALLAAVGQARVTVGSHRIPARASVGLVAVSQPTTAEEALAWADRAMYRAKSKGGGQVWSET
jgi:diguanylate cyclase (GGDEF)-like protein/PAS domain S-box-containing protein